jgi:hypothetical protein
MFPTIIDGKLMVPITPSIIETAPGEWLCVERDEEDDARRGRL